jgi:hypothetical protein
MPRQQLRHRGGLSMAMFEQQRAVRMKVRAGLKNDGGQCLQAGRPRCQRQRRLRGSLVERRVAGRHVGWVADD